jgi:polar amino acid transport system substrate-binding protein
MRNLIPNAMIGAFLTALLLSPGPVLAQSGVKTSPVIPLFWRQQDIDNPPDTSTIKRLRFATSADYPPFNYLDRNRQLAGLNVDLLRAICTELKIECSIAVKPWNELIQTLKAGEVDAIMAGLAITPGNLRKVSFTRPYFRTPARFVVKKGARLKGFAPGELVNTHIGVINNSAHEAYLKAMFQRSNFVAYRNAAEMRKALQGGRIDAFFDDGVQSGFWIRGRLSANCCAFRGGAYTESFYFGAGMGIAVKRGNIKLARILDYTLAKLAMEGKYAKLVRKHIPFSLY